MTDARIPRASGSTSASSWPSPRRSRSRRAQQPTTLGGRCSVLGETTQAAATKGGGHVVDRNRIASAGLRTRRRRSQWRGGQHGRRARRIRATPLHLADTEGGRTADYAANMVVAPRLAVGALVLKPAKVGRTYRAKEVAATGGVLPKVWKLTRGPLPRGIRFDRTRSASSAGRRRSRARLASSFQITDSLKVVAGGRDASACRRPRRLSTGESALSGPGHAATTGVHARLRRE